MKVKLPNSTISWLASSRLHHLPSISTLVMHIHMLRISNSLMIIVNFHTLNKVDSQVNAFESSSQPTVSKLTDERVVECDSPGE